MSESFESKLKRVGFSIKMDARGRIIIRTSNNKIVSGIILVLLGMVLIPLIVSPVNLLLQNFKSINIDLELFINLIILCLGVFGIILFYKGAIRLFQCSGYKLVVDVNEVCLEQRNDVHKQLLMMHNPFTFECLSDNDDHVIILCHHANGTTELIKEKNNTTDCYPTLGHLTAKLQSLLI